MATAAPPRLHPIAGERLFFFVMACAMAAVIVSGFAVDLLLGRASFGLPPIFHIHAFFFFGWVALYVTQNALVATDHVALHRRLGPLALLWVPVMVALGITLTILSVRGHGGPFFFDENEFLIGNPIGILTFAALVAAALRLRRRPDWHRRLMYCAMASLTGPAFGRMLPGPLMIPWAWWIVAVIVPMIFPLIGVIADKRRAGRVHPAWFCGLGAMAGSLLLTDAIAYSPIGYAVTRQVTAGTPGAARPMKAYLPS